MAATHGTKRQGQGSQQHGSGSRGIGSMPTVSLERCATSCGARYCNRRCTTAAGPGQNGQMGPARAGAPLGTTRACAQGDMAYKTMLRCWTGRQAVLSSGELSCLSTFVELPCTLGPTSSASGLPCSCWLLQGGPDKDIVLRETLTCSSGQWKTQRCRS